MDHRLQFHRILLVMVTACIIQAKVVEQKYRKQKPGQNMTGTIGAIYMTHSMGCGSRCSSDVKCVAYQHTGTLPGNCLLIHRNSTADDGQTFITQGRIVLYKKECSLDCKNGGSCADGIEDIYQCWCPDGYYGLHCEAETDEYDSMPCVHGNCSDMINTYKCICPAGYFGQQCESCNISWPWTPPPGWIGPDPVAYRSFDSSDGLMMMEGTEEANLTFITGKINDAVSLNQARRQWIDLGILQEACIPRPQNCATVGGAGAFWMRITCSSPDDSWPGIIASSEGAHVPRIWIGIHYNRSMLYQIITLDGNFWITNSQSSGWTHIVLNYVGPNNGQGIRIYQDGVPTIRDDTKDSVDYTPGSGNVVVGRHDIFTDYNYAGVDVDELLFFNQLLSDQEIMEIKNMV